VAQHTIEAGKWDWVVVDTLAARHMAEVGSQDRVVVDRLVTQDMAEVDRGDRVGKGIRRHNQLPSVLASPDRGKPGAAATRDTGPCQ
jgi:hypothetical protein